ncbi:S41 family peptidase [Tenacibaculum sp. 190524A05c]|uniref:S41 family peptidase n=1 Tax=Tenacibaculum platacis TaxID=3137852 RepID=UPI0032B14424
MTKAHITFILLLVCGNIFSQVNLPNTLSKEDKIYGLSKFWQEVNYNFIYLNKVDKEKWNNDYKEYINKVQETQNDYEYYRLLRKFCATLKDGHTSIHLSKSLRKLIYNTAFGDYYIQLTNIEGKAIVTGITENKKNEIPIGTEIIKVNGIPTIEYANKYVKPYIASSTNYVLENKMISRLLSSPKGTKYNLELKKPNGQIFNLKVTHQELTDKKIYPPYKQEKLLEFKWKENNIAYLALNGFSDPKIISMFLEKLPEIRKAEKLIIDLRSNNGGSSNVGWQILQYFTKDDILLKSTSRSRLHIPAYKAWGRWTKPKDTINVSEKRKQKNKQALLSLNDNYYYSFPYNPYKIELSKKERIIIPTAILIGNKTASAAEDFLISADNQKHMIKIGQASNGSTGQPIVFDLPGGGIARVCTKEDTYPSGKVFVGVGIQPDIETALTLNDFQNNNDSTLQIALEYLNKINN